MAASCHPSIEKRRHGEPHFNSIIAQPARRAVKNQKKRHRLPKNWKKAC
jgi:hypothetical protein